MATKRTQMVSPDEKPSESEYLAWLAHHDEQRYVASAAARHDTVSAKLQSDISGSECWRLIASSLREWNDRYNAVSGGYNLWVSEAVPPVAAKPFVSVLNKSFRKNVVHNKNFPDGPSNGSWICPSTWYSQINDVVRTTFVVKYLDGVSFVVEQLRAVAESCGQSFRVDFEAKDKGYYAAHVYLEFELDVPRLDWTYSTETVNFELQVTTQLQDVIRRLTHENYSADRSLPQSSSVPWQWNYTSPEFVPNYLGHLLHYVEGMIMEIRNRKAPDNG